MRTVAEPPTPLVADSRATSPAAESALQRNRVRNKLPLTLGMVVVLAALALYVRTLAPSVMPGDYAEFQMAAAILGVPHPTGYPLYVILGKLFTLLPFGDVAYRVNLSSAVYMAGAVGMLYAVACRVLRLLGWRGAWWAAGVAALFFAISPTVWEMALLARSYALNALLVSGVILSLVQWRHTGRAGWFYAACALIGLSMVHHGTTYLLLPAYGLYLLLVEWERRGNAARGGGNAEPATRSLLRGGRLRRWGFGVLSFAAGLSPILFLVYRFVWGAPYYWGNPRTWKDFFSLLTGGPFHNQVMGYGTGLDVQAGRVAFGVGELAGQYTLAGVAIGALGLVVLWRLMRPEAILLTLMMAGNFAFAMNYSLVGYLYFIPTYLIWGIFIAVGLGRLGEAIGRRLVTPPGRAALAAGAGVFGIAVLLAAANLVLLRYPNIDQSGRTETRDEALALLQAAPQRATLYLDWEDISVIRFYRMVYGVRRDLTLQTGDPADWAKWVYCDLADSRAAFVGEFAGALPPAVARDFETEPAPMGWRVVRVRNPGLYEVPPCGTCATCR